MQRNLAIPRRPLRMGDTTWEVYRYIVWYLASHLTAPSIREIAAEVRLKSSATVWYHLNRLQEARLVERNGEKFQNRNIRPVGFELHSTW